MSNTKMMLIGLMMVAAVVFGMVMAGISNNSDKGRIREADYSAKTESDVLVSVDEVSEAAKSDADQEKITVIPPRDGYGSNSYRVNDKKLENFSIEWIHGNLRRNGYRVSSILVHAMNYRRGEYVVSGMAEIKTNMKRRMRINWVIVVTGGSSRGYVVIKADLTEPFFVTG